MSDAQATQTGAVLFQWWYCAVEEKSYYPELGYYRTYGLQIIGRVGDEWKVLDVLHDVSVSQNDAETMAALFTRNKLSPIQFREVVEDML
ncbi:conserved hypothetical protein [uncultured Eubacteriales bacterium]|uniref:Uncharacterized protein n=1 Tax=uncultured Eubacteriales bacterium TaxID=172733 RepID=A0A212KE66_9FIRM|nr:conserved hypothetical protein [uncultured Eubacteriales bacterium]SBW09971.1 conserved hypothetical protein [uncultured Eubacteriales bacterium]